jgi:hypothetical protein
LVNFKDFQDFSFADEKKLNLQALKHLRNVSTLCKRRTVAAHRTGAKKIISTTHPRDAFIYVYWRLEAAIKEALVG